MAMVKIYKKRSKGGYMDEKQCLLLQSLYGKRVYARRIEMGMSQAELAKKSSLHHTYISSLEKGQRNVSLNNIFKIAKALKWPVSDLFKDMEKNLLESISGLLLNHPEEIQNLIYWACTLDVETKAATAMAYKNLKSEEKNKPS